MDGQRSFAEEAIPSPTTLLEQHIPKLRNFARGLVRGDQDRADDLLQDSLLRALSGWSRRRCNGNLRAWLYRILYNRFVTDQRRRRSHATLTEVLDDDLSSADGGQEAMLTYRDLRRGFADLPDDQRAVLLLIGVEDFSYEEAACILRVPIGTVMSRLSRGRERLRQHLNGSRVPTGSLQTKRQRPSPSHRHPVICRA
jgi:RNA polymerase sigma-70 factor (ECF subfamily)